MTEDLTGRVKELERRVAAIEGSMKSGGESVRDQKPLSIREFVNSKKPKTSVDATLLIGFYLEKSAKVSPFTSDDLSRGFAEAREPRPGNLSDMIYKNVRKGFFTGAAGKKEGSKSYIVTNSGERFIENGLHGESGA